MFAVKSTKVAGIALALAALCATGSALAQAKNETVSYADLDLTREAGVNALDRRLHQAVRRVCGEEAMATAAVRRLVRRCREETWASIEPQRSFAIARASSPSRGLAYGPRGTSIRLAAAD